MVSIFDRTHIKQVWFNIFLNQRCVVTLMAGVLVALSAIALLVNAFVYHYPGINYFPPNNHQIVITIILVCLGFNLQYGKRSRPTKIAKEVIVFYAVMAVIALATNAVQYTPFSTIDTQIVAFEKMFHFNLTDAMRWTSAHPLLKEILIIAYESLAFQIAFLPLWMIVRSDLAILDEYYLLLLLTTLIGFVFYYFFPTTAPASVIKNQYFFKSQIATGLKFMQVHQHINPTTMDGGLISFPSFHVIWAWLCLYLMRGSILIIILFPLNILAIISCVLLGWHYPSDLLGSAVILMLAHGFCIMQRATAKRSKSGRKNHTAIEQISVLNNLFP